MCIPLQFTGIHCRFLSEAGHTKGGEPKTSLRLYWSPGHNHGQPIVSTQTWLVNFLLGMAELLKNSKMTSGHSWQMDMGPALLPSKMFVTSTFFVIFTAIIIINTAADADGKCQCLSIHNNPLHRLLGRCFSMTAQVAAVQKEGVKHNNVWVVCVTIFYCWH